MSAFIDDGGPAFPNNDKHGCAYTGMTLRDYFAGQAMTAWIEDFCRNAPSEEPAKDVTIKIASYCYLMANAMIAARKEGQS
jgi:hypothetical protein